MITRAQKTCPTQPPGRVADASTDAAEIPLSLAAIPIQWKRCGRCGQTKRERAFYRNAAKPDGRSAWCKRCEVVYQKLAGQAATVAKIAARKREIQARAELGKACFRCGVVKPLFAFPKDARKPDGRKATCTLCATPDRRASWAKCRAQQTTVGGADRHDALQLLPIPGQARAARNQGAGDV
jgi:hypothetical protein